MLNGRIKNKRFEVIISEISKSKEVLSAASQLSGQNLFSMMIKTVKVQGRYRACKSNLEIKRGTGKVVPEIRLNGIWLAELGFLQNSNLLVEVVDGMIILKHLKEDSGRPKNEFEV